MSRDGVAKKRTAKQLGLDAKTVRLNFSGANPTSTAPLEWTYLEPTLRVSGKSARIHVLGLMP